EGGGFGSPQPGAQRGPLAEREPSQKQAEGAGGLLPGGQGGAMPRPAGERGDPARAVLRQTRGGKASEEQRRRRTADEQPDDLASFHSITSSASCVSKRKDSTARWRGRT